MNSQDKIKLERIPFEGMSIDEAKVRYRAQELTLKYNQIASNNLTERYDILKELLGSVHPDIIIESNFHCDNGKNIFIGKNFFANFNLTILDVDKVTIGDNVLIAPNVQLITVTHPLNVKERNTWKLITAPIVIGDNVWLGAGVIVLPGVTIGNNSVIGAGSIVTKNISANTLAFGTPCREMRQIPQD
ncbi:MAG: sugar O-acetyltransferase [Neisseriaceae bacterium]|nr:MAG: sugar O-acetyltransferase [Neisseriaceae bacterium]